MADHVPGYEVDFKDACITNGLDLATHLVDEAYCLLAAYTNGCSGCTTALLKQITDTVAGRYLHQSKPSIINPRGFPDEDGRIGPTLDALVAEAKPQVDELRAAAVASGHLGPDDADHHHAHAIYL